MADTGNFPGSQRASMDLVFQPRGLPIKTILQRAVAACTLALLVWLAAMAFASSARAAAPLPGYEIVRLGRGHYNRICLAATIGGKKGLLIVDTGANGSALSDATYGWLLTTGSQSRSPQLPRRVSVNGLAVPIVAAPDCMIGQTNFGPFHAALIARRFLFDDSPLDSTRNGRNYDGIFGENLLRRANAVIDCGRLALYLNTDPVRRLPLAAAFVRNGWTRVPMSDAGNDFTVPCVLNGHSFRLLVDTGAPFTNLDRNLLGSAGISARDIPLKGGLIGMRPTEAGLVNITSLQIGDYTAYNVHMTTNSQSFSAFDQPHGGGSSEPILGLLGGDTLAANGAVIDIGNKALYLKRGNDVAAKSPKPVH